MACCLEALVGHYFEEASCAHPKSRSKWYRFEGVPSGLTKSEGREWGVRSVVVGFGVFGAPRFSVQRSQNAYL